MTLQVFTAHRDHADPDALDITRLSGTCGQFLAPSWAILRPYQQRRRAAEAMGCELDQPVWDEYARSYEREIRDEVRRHPEPLRTLLAKDRVVLECYCRNPLRCHRRVAARVLVDHGAQDCGEIGFGASLDDVAQRMMNG